MSASSWTSKSPKKGSPKETPADATQKDSQEWIGVDFAHSDRARPSRALLPLLVIGLFVGLAIASLRIDLIRTRYALAAATAEEKKLIAEQHALIVRKRQLVDPVGLVNLARERGFQAAEASRVLLDPLPTERGFAPNRPTDSLPAVAAPPPMQRDFPAAPTLAEAP